VTDHLIRARRVAIGGMLLENKPSALVRALISVGAHGLFLTSGPASSWDADVLVAAQAVSRVRIPHVSLGSIGLAPAVRRAAETGQLAIEDCEEAMLLGGLIAAAGRAQFQPLGRLGRNDVVDGNPLLVEHAGICGVPPSRIDVALLHAPAADDHGNVVHHGSRWADLLLARCANRVIVQVDGRISTREARRIGVAIPGYLTHEIIEIPYGAHPLGSVGLYTADMSHLKMYRDMVVAGRAPAYLSEYIVAAPEDYAALIGPRQLAALSVGAT
jgi:glutaconate CoA-transferase, subunit A